MNHLHKTCLVPGCEEDAEFELEIEPADRSVGIMNASAYITSMECEDGHTLDDVPEKIIDMFDRQYAGEWADEVAENDWYDEGDELYHMWKDEGRI